MRSSAAPARVCDARSAPGSLFVDAVGSSSATTSSRNRGTDRGSARCQSSRAWWAPIKSPRRIRAFATADHKRPIAPGAPNDGRRSPHRWRAARPPEPALSHSDAGADRGHEGVLGPPTVLAVVRARACAWPRRRGRALRDSTDQGLSTQSPRLDQGVVDATGVVSALGEVIDRRIEFERAVALQTGRELDPRQDRRVVDRAGDLLCGDGMGGRVVERQPLERQLREPHMDLPRSAGSVPRPRRDVAEWDGIRALRVQCDP